jgi:hypothetical protein
LELIVVFRQIHFAKDRPLGYDSNGLVSLPMITENIHQHFDAVKGDTTTQGSYPRYVRNRKSNNTGMGNQQRFDWKGKDPNLSVDFPRVDVSYEYGKTINWEFTEGRDFSKDYAGDSSVLF